jgi:hypothetical protein
MAKLAHLTALHHFGQDKKAEMAILVTLLRENQAMGPEFC